MKNFLDKLKFSATHVVSAIDKIKSSTIPITLSNDSLNHVASKALTKDDVIKSVMLSMHSGWFQAKAKISHNLAEFSATVDFEIVRFEVGKQVQVIQLRQTGKLETDSQGWHNQIAVYVIKIIITSFLGKNLLHWGLKGQDGITFDEDLITVDLAKLGAKDAFLSAMAERVGESARFLLPFIDGGADKLSEFININGAECVEGALKINVASMFSPE